MGRIDKIFAGWGTPSTPRKKPCLSNLWRIRRFFDQDTCAHVVRALIISHLDYCNSPLHRISKYEINRLQRLQNKATKLVFALGGREHVTPLLKDLYWLCMDERIKFKVLLHIYKCLHGQNPSCLKEAMVLYTPGHAGLRSNLDATRLVTPKHAPLVIGVRSFFKAGPRLWNLILAAIRSAQSIEVFKKQLNTHLFAESYLDWLLVSAFSSWLHQTALWLFSIFY